MSTLPIEGHRTEVGLWWDCFSLSYPLLVAQCQGSLCKLGFPEDVPCTAVDSACVWGQVTSVAIWNQNPFFCISTAPEVIVGPAPP